MERPVNTSLLAIELWIILISWLINLFDGLPLSTLSTHLHPAFFICHPRNLTHDHYFAACLCSYLILRSSRCNDMGFFLNLRIYPLIHQWKCHCIYSQRFFIADLWNPWVHGFPHLPILHPSHLWLLTCLHSCWTFSIMLIALLCGDSLVALSSFASTL